MALFTFASYVATQQNATFWMGVMTPKFELGRDFCTVHPIFVRQSVRMSEIKNVG